MLVLFCMSTMRRSAERASSILGLLPCPKIDVRSTALCRKSLANAVCAANDELPSKVSSSSGPRHVLGVVSSSSSSSRPPPSRLDGVRLCSDRFLDVSRLISETLVPAIPIPGPAMPFVVRFCSRRSIPASRSSIWSIFRSLRGHGVSLWYM